MVQSGGNIFPWTAKEGVGDHSEHRPGSLFWITQTKKLPLILQPVQIHQTVP